MSSPDAILSPPKQCFSVRRWLFAFFAPTYAFAMAHMLLLILMAVRFPEFHAWLDFLLEHKAGLGDFLFLSVGIANVLGLWFCLREVSRVPNSGWQRTCLSAATVFGLAAQTVVVGLFLGANFYYR